MVSKESILRRVRQRFTGDIAKSKGGRTGKDRYGSAHSLPQDDAQSISDLPNIRVQDSATSNLQPYSGRTLTLRQKAKTLYNRKRGDFANRLRKSSASYSDDQLTDLGEPTPLGGSDYTRPPSWEPRDDAQLPTPPVSPYAESAPRSPGSGMGSPSKEPKNKSMGPAHRFQRRLTRSGGELMHIGAKRRDSTPPSSEGGSAPQSPSSPNFPSPNLPSPNIPPQRSRDLRPMSMRYKARPMPQQVQSKLAESPELVPESSESPDSPYRGRPPPLAGRRSSTSTLNKTPSLGFSFEPDYNRIAPPPTNLRKRRSRSDPRDQRRRSKIEE